MNRLLMISFLIFTPSIFGASVLKDFELVRFDNNQKTSLSQLLKENDRVVLNFWASWCTACIEELPDLESLKSKALKNKRKVAFIGINAGEKKKKIMRFLKKRKYSYTILKDRDRLYSKSVGVNELPQTIIVDRNKKILFQGNRPPSLIP